MIPMIQVLQSYTRMLWCKGFEINQFWSETLEKLMHVPKTRWYQCWKWGKGWKSEIVVDQICQGLCSGWWLLWCYSSLQAITLSSHWKMKVEYLTNNEELLKHREKTKFWHKWWRSLIGWNYKKSTRGYPPPPILLLYWLIMIWLFLTIDDIQL